MIANLDELVAFTRQIADKLPEFQESIRLDRPGIKATETQRLLELLPEMPKSYWSVAQSLNLNGVAIGYFQLSPSSRPGISLVQKLLDVNDLDNNPQATRYQADGVYQIASWEADPIAIAHNSGSFRTGQIVLYHAGNPALPANVLADDFEEFLLLAGTLDQVRDKHCESDDFERAREVFSSYIDKRSNDRNHDMAATWKRIAEVVLD